MLSIETVPTSGTRRPSTRTVGVVGQPAPHAVAVADRDRAEPGLALGDEAASVARALPRQRALDLGDVAGELERRLEAVVGRVAVERVHAVDGDPAADHVESGVRTAQRRGRVRRVDGSAGMTRDPLGEQGQLLVDERLVARRTWRNGSSAPRAGRRRRRPRATPRPGRGCRAGPCRCRASRARAGRRGSAATNSSRQATTSARAEIATESSSGESAPITSSGPSMPAARRVAASPAVATASDAAPPRSAARAAGTAPCP